VKSITIIFLIFTGVYLQVAGQLHSDRFDHAAWDEIPVPSNWQMEGFGYPLFRNIGLPFGMDPSGVPKDFNPLIP